LQNSSGQHLTKSGPDGGWINVQTIRANGGIV
jgi:hypothetical protein